MGLLENKRGVILGVANKRSIAWGIAKAADREGARLVLTYQGERLRSGIESLIPELRTPPLLLPCDVTDEAQMDALFEQMKRELGSLDFLVHALAFARKEDLSGRFLDVDHLGWTTAIQISAYSFAALAKRAAPLMEGRAGSLVTLSYLGGERVVSNYNIMGIAKSALESAVRYLAADLGPSGHRVNAVSAGPVKTLAAAGISGFSKMLEVVAERTPMRRNVTADEVGDAALFFLSDLSRSVTGEVLHVDCGYSVMGL